MWFISAPGSESESEKLRQRATTAIASLLRILKNVEDQRSHRIDRTTDFRVLARWFAQAVSDAQAHQLWRAAFGLCPARHLTINEASIEERDTRDIPTTTSWLDAPPLRITSASHTRHRYFYTGEFSRIIDRGAGKRRLAAASHAEAQRLLNAQRRLGTGNRLRLSELERLEPDEFEMLLDVLGEAVSARVFPTESVDIISADGCLHIQLEPTGDGRSVCILTEHGMFSGPDHWIRLEPIAADEPEEVMR